MREYWLKNLKKNETAVYIGHISAEDKSYGIDEDYRKKMNDIKKESDMTGLRLSILRDLLDRYPCCDGSYYGCDVWLIVQKGPIKKNQILINKLKDVFLED